MKVQITKQHIENGKYDIADECPVALAILDKVEPGTRVRVWGSRINIGYTSLSVNRNLQRFIENFDRGKQVKPRVEDIKIPKQLLRKKTK